MKYKHFEPVLLHLRGTGTITNPNQSQKNQENHEIDMWIQTYISSLGN